MKTFALEVPKAMTVKQFGDTLFRTTLYTPMARYVAGEFAAGLEDEPIEDAVQEAK